VTSSRVADVLAQQTELEVREVHLDVVQDDPDALVAALGVDGDDPADVLVVDSTDRRDLTAIARAAAACVGADGEHPWLAVDPGPFAPELATALGLTHPARSAPHARRTGLPLLVVAGSVTATTREQLVALEQVHDATLVDVDVTALVGSDAEVARTVDALVDLVDAAPAGAVVGLRTAASEDRVVDLDRDQAAAVPARLGAVVRDLLDRVEVGGLYVTGGDVTVGVLDALGGSGMAIDDEVLPLAVTGRLVGGPRAGLRLVTKGGLIGDRTAAVTCVDELRRRSIDDRKAPS
jgi:D-threonate/D-erythronate kinase